MRNWIPPRPNAAQDLVLLVMFLASAFALLRLAGERPPTDAPPDMTAAAADTPAPVVTTAPHGQAFIDHEFHGPPARPPDDLDPAETASEGAAADSTPADTTATPAATEPHSPPEPVWTVIDVDRYPIDADTVSLYARLPGPYEWPLPRIDRLTLICFRKAAELRHIGIMQTADGLLFHWGEERRYLQEHLDATRIDSTEIRTVANPRAFMEPLRAAVHGACQRSADETEAAGTSGQPPTRTTAPNGSTARANAS